MADKNVLLKNGGGQPERLPFFTRLIFWRGAGLLFFGGFLVYFLTVAEAWVPLWHGSKVVILVVIFLGGGTLACLVLLVSAVYWRRRVLAKMRAVD